jgi:hypothetical protein
MSVSVPEIAITLVDSRRVPVTVSYRSPALGVRSIRASRFVKKAMLFLAVGVAMADVGCGPPQGSAVLSKEDAVVAKEAQRAAHERVKKAGVRK